MKEEDLVMVIVDTPKIIPHYQIKIMILILVDQDIIQIAQVLIGDKFLLFYIHES